MHMSGEQMDADTLHLLVTGQIDPHSLQPFVCEDSTSHAIMPTPAPSMSSSSSSSSSCRYRTEPEWGISENRLHDSRLQRDSKLTAIEEEDKDRKIWSFDMHGSSAAHGVDYDREDGPSIGGKRKLPWRQSDFVCNPEISSVFANFPSHSGKAVCRQYSGHSTHLETGDVKGSQQSFGNGTQGHKSIELLRSVVSDEQSRIMATLPETLHRRRRRLQLPSLQQEQELSLGLVSDTDYKFWIVRYLHLCC